MKLTVFKNQYGYSTLAKNGEDKMYLSVQFKKGQEPSSDKARIKIEDGFFSMYKNKVGLAFPKLVVMSYTVEENEQQSKLDYVPFADSDVPSFDDSDLPF
jgi:hypothetical protein